MKAIVFFAGLLTTTLAPAIVTATETLWYGLALVFIGCGLMFLSIVIEFPKKG